jgi:hypothetical protein
MGTIRSITPGRSILSCAVLVLSAACTPGASGSTDGKVTVTNFPTVQPVSGTVNVGNFPATQPVSGSVAVSNFPMVQPVSGSLTVTGSVDVSNFPALQSVSVTNFPASQAVTGAVSITNLPATQPVSGTVNVGNLPATQPVSGSVSVSNFPATQPVSGLVTANPMPYGVFNMNVLASSAGMNTATQTFNVGTHAVEAHALVNVTVTGASGVPVLVSISLNLASGAVKFPLALPYSALTDGAGSTYYVGQYQTPIWIPANTDVTITATVPPATGTPTGISVTVSMSGLNLS